MNVVRYWLRLELHRRWRSLTVLVLLIAVASGAVMTALAGARRNASALERLEARTLPATAAVLANTPDFDWGNVRKLPEVEAYTTFGPSFTIEGLPDSETEPAMQPATMRTIERGIVQRGRMFNPRRSDEGVVPPGFLSRYHLKLGAVVTVVLPTPKELAQAAASGAVPDSFAGPRLHVHIVGVVLSHWFGDGMVLSQGVVAKYAANVVGNSTNPDRPLYANALFRLKGGKATIPQFREDVVRATGRADLEVLDLSQWEDRPVQQQASFAARCLLAFGIAALLAAVFLVGQAIARYVASSAVDLQTLRPLGMSPRQAISAAAAGPTVAAVAGGAIGVVVAIFASSWFPIGIASQAEPSPGISVDLVVLGPGLLVVVLLTAGATIASAALALGRGAREVRSRRSAIATVVARAGLPVPIVVGSRFALESGRGRNAIPVRPALIGAVAGVLGVLAAFTFSRGVADAADHPERFGQTFQLSADIGNAGQNFGPTDKLIAGLRGNDIVQGVDDARVGVATGPGGNGSVSLYTYSSGAKQLPVVVTSGRMPRSAGEVLLAPQSIAALHTRVGGQVALSGNKGTTTFTVSGSGLVPSGYHNGYADGGWITDGGFDTLFSGFKFHTVYVAVNPQAGAGGAALNATIAKTVPEWAGLTLQPPAQLAQVSGLRQVRALPLILGFFLALLAVGAIGHALATAVRRRSHDLAVLRALGMTQWQCRWVVVVQASLLALIGLVFGVPLGIAVGRTVWRAVADYTPFEYVTPVAFWALLLVGPGALLIANLLAAWPGQHAARTRIAKTLRTE